jgi:KTSC domain
MERMKITSQLLRSAGYDPDKKVLEVEFLRIQNEHSRRVYQYFDVPIEKFIAMMGLNLTEEDQKKHSIGSYFLVHIRPNYESKRLEEPREKAQEDSPETS